MKRTLALGRWDAGTIGLSWIPGRLVVAGALSGVVSGIALGAITGPIGVVLGMWMGVGVGIVTGYVLSREDEKRSVRTQELDSIIGVTRGSLGAGMVANSPARARLGRGEADLEEVAAYSSKEAWLKEWLTPPPPSVD
jgi:hypothetical protein